MRVARRGEVWCNVVCEKCGMVGVEGGVRVEGLLLLVLVGSVTTEDWT